MSAEPMQDIQKWTDKWWLATCPGCGFRARIDGDQYEGNVSVDCPECEYHETHDLREEP